LTVTPGIWPPTPVSVSEQWQRCSGATCTPIIPSVTSLTYTLTAADVGQTIEVVETATYAGGVNGVATSVPTSVITPPAPTSTSPPTISGIAGPGQTLTETNGAWTNNPTSFSYQWRSCDSSGSACSAIAGATNQTYTVADGDVGRTIVVQESATNAGGKGGLVNSAPTAVVTASTSTTLVTSSNAPVANETLILIATVTSSVSAAAPSGAVTFSNGGRAIRGCANLSVTPTGQSATIVCRTSFGASTALLTAAFTPTAGSSLTGSTSDIDALRVGHDSSSISLDASKTVNVGVRTTYTATVTPPASRPGPIEPSGSVEFFDGGQPIGSCLSQELVNGGATCTITYKTRGMHSITAGYGGDANFRDSTSPAQPVSVVPVPAQVLGTITSTMQWTFLYTPAYTKVLALIVNGAPNGATVLVTCHGRGCPYAKHATRVAGSPCGSRTCLAPGRIDLTRGFKRHRLRLGAQITVMIIRPGWIGKYFTFTVRPRRGPRIKIACLAPGGTRPGVAC
jgi:hypothetical protein